MIKGYIIDLVKGSSVDKITKALSASPEIKTFTLDESSWVLMIESDRNVDNLVEYAIEEVGKAKVRIKLNKRDLKMIKSYVARRLKQSAPSGWELHDY